MDSPAPALVSLIDPHVLISPRRFDLAVKWRFFRDMLPGPKAPWAEGIYRWHIAERMDSNAAQGVGMDANKARNVDEYVNRARELFRSMRVDFDEKQPIPVDPNLQLLDGAHRTACALALNCEVVIAHMDHEAWAPAWDLRWFQNHAPIDVMALVLDDWQEMCRSS